MHYPDYTIISERDVRRSEKEFEVEIPAETLERSHALHLKKLSAEAQVPGFRKGKVPEAIVLSKVGEMRVLEQAADELVHEALVSVLKEKQLTFVGQPSISITMLARNNPLRFKMQVAILPTISLPDYKSLAARENSKQRPEISVSDKELDESLMHIRKILAHQDGAARPEKEASNSEPAPLTDALVKKLGNFASVADFTEKLKNDLQTDKQAREREKHVLGIIEKIVAATDLELPEPLIEHELDRIEAEFNQDIERMGQKPDEYLKTIRKTREELRKEWHSNAEKRAKFELILPRIARAENLNVPAEDIERESKHLLEHYKDADKEAAKLYVERVLLRQKVLEFLEKQK